MNAPTLIRPETRTHLRLQNIGGNTPYDTAALRLINALDALAPKARPQVCSNLNDRIEEAERMAEAMKAIRSAFADFLVPLVGEADGWIGALNAGEDTDFNRDPIECFDMVTDRWEQFAAENREMHLAEIA